MKIWTLSPCIPTTIPVTVRPSWCCHYFDVDSTAVHNCDQHQRKGVYCKLRMQPYVTTFGSVLMQWISLSHVNLKTNVWVCLGLLSEDYYPISVKIVTSEELFALGWFRGQFIVTQVTMFVHQLYTKSVLSIFLSVRWFALLREPHISAFVSSFYTAIPLEEGACCGMCWWNFTIPGSFLTLCNLRIPCESVPYQIHIPH